MLARDIDAYEADTLAYIRRKGQLSDATYHGVPVLRYAPPRSGYYYRNERKKDGIVLHFTAGYLGGDLSTLTQNDYHVSVPFVVARNGAIIQLFEPKYWSYHLGRGAVGGNTDRSRSTIGIELSNIGYLQRNGNWIWSYVGEKYCQVSEKNFYEKGPQHRGYEYFASYTRPQMKSCRLLIDALCADFGIEREILDEPKRYELFGSSSEARSYRGVCSHVNYRASGKWDIGPSALWGAVA